MIDRLRHGALAFTRHIPYTLVLPQGYSAARPWPLVVALHGMGHNEELMRRFMGPLLERPWIWVFPRGPHSFEMRQPEKIRIGHAWYHFDGDQDALRRSMQETAAHLLNLHDLLRKDYPIASTAVVGFSQGGYMAGYVAPRNPERFRAAACLGGRIKHEFLHDAPRTVALAQFHGEKDENVSPAMAREALEKCAALGFEDTHFYSDPDAGHEVSAPLVTELGKWLERVLA